MGYSPQGHKRVGHDLVTKQQLVYSTRKHMDFFFSSVVALKNVFLTYFTLNYNVPKSSVALVGKYV